MLAKDFLLIWGGVALLFHVLGIISAYYAVLRTRTSQGAIAWTIALLTFPYLAVPAYWILGRRKYHGYADARRAGDDEISRIAARLDASVQPFIPELSAHDADYHALEKLARMQFTHSNNAELLVDGQATFDAIFAGIDSAEDYVLVQFFIIKDDRLGRDLQAHLLRKAKAGVRVYTLYDEVGSHALSQRYIEELRAAGAQIEEFKTTKGRGNRFQLNFRNHRKIVVVDGREAYVGGHNVGDEYMGRDPEFGHWRDTHTKITGPAVQGVQLSFIEDWHWATHEIPELHWHPAAAEGDGIKVLVLPTGPADELETCQLFFLHAINAARSRIWISSPYFVPDIDVTNALQLAGLRGVDVRIMLPEKVDHLLVWLSAFAYLEEAEATGVKFYRYQDGFLHQKTMLIDDQVSAIGTANMDNRSFRLNFEITLLFADEGFAEEVEKMFAADFNRCRLASADDLRKRSRWFNFQVRAARLAAPVQ